MDRAQRHTQCIQLNLITRTLRLLYILAQLLL
jgi:hypothetical protein